MKKAAKSAAPKALTNAQQQRRYRNAVRDNCLKISRGEKWNSPDLDLIVKIVPSTIQAAQLALSAGQHDRFNRLMDRLEVQIAGIDSIGHLPLSLAAAAE